MIKPVFTEKSLKMAKDGKYSFWVTNTLNKFGIKVEVAKIFGVHVASVHTIVSGSESGRTARGKKFNKLNSKKAIVTLKEGEKIDIYEEAKK